MVERYIIGGSIVAGWDLTTMFELGGVDHSKFEVIFLLNKCVNFKLVTSISIRVPRGLIIP